MGGQSWDMQPDSYANRVRIGVGFASVSIVVIDVRLVIYGKPRNCVYYSTVRNIGLLCIT